MNLIGITVPNLKNFTLLIIPYIFLRVNNCINFVLIFYSPAILNLDVFGSNFELFRGFLHYNCIFSAFSQKKITFFTILYVIYIVTKL